MTVQHASLSVGTTALSVRSTIADKSGVGNDSVAFTVTLTNEGSNPVYIGGTGVTTAAYGYKLAASGEKTLDLGESDDPYVIAGTGTNTVRVLYTRA